MPPLDDNEKPNKRLRILIIVKVKKTERTQNFPFESKEIK